MTGQIADQFFYRNEQYQLVGLKGRGLPTPFDFGMQPVMMHTACYRGYYCDYTIRDERLLLTHLVVRTRDNRYPTIDGVAPIIEQSRLLAPDEPDPPKLHGRYVGIGSKGRHLHYDGAIYANLTLQTRFTGGLLIAKDFIQSMYVHMGFQKPTSFTRVCEMLFEDGRLTSAFDLSEKVAEIRAELLNPRAPNDGQDSAEREERIKRWIAWTFSLDYDL